MVRIEKANKKITLPNKIAMSIATATAMMGGYAGRIQAAGCNSLVIGGSAFVCNDPTFATQNLNGINGQLLLVSTTSDFSIDTNAGDALTITATGMANGLRFNDGDDANMIHGEENGIAATNETSHINGIHITTSGEVSGEQKHGIYAHSKGNSTKGVLIITTAGSSVSSSAKGSGIFVKNEGTHTTLAVYGDATGVNGVGVTHDGNDLLAITVGADATIEGKGSETSIGVLAAVINQGPDVESTMTIHGTVKGVLKGISSQQFTNAPLSITMTSSAEVTATDYGIDALTSKDDIITITVNGNVESEAVGISARTQNGIGKIDIIVSGNIEAGDFSEAIRTETEANGHTTITLNTDARLVGSISNNDGPSNITIKGNAEVARSLFLQGGSDVVTFSDGAGISNLTTINGGDDFDTLSFVNTSEVLPGDMLTNWEILNIDNATIGFSDAMLAVDRVVVNNTGILDATAGLSLTGKLDNDSTVLMQDDDAVDTLTVSDDYTGSGGSIKLDTVLGDSNSATDKLVIEGDSAGLSNIAINNLAGLGATTAGDGVLLVEIVGNSNGTFSLINSPMVVNGFSYTLAKVNKDWYLQSTALCAMEGDVVVPLGVVDNADVVAIIDHVLASTSEHCSDINNANGTTIHDVVEGINLAIPIP